MEDVRFGTSGGVRLAAAAAAAAAAADALEFVPRGLE